ncbi:S8 family serine peptidase [Dactylosporangium sp. NPDC051541]|uniref:S53 family peptidase n=1 Tax=Dactylosporangium sp. NPDC051541 TaxID=3363977 RepID=UPI0037BC315F
MKLISIVSRAAVATVVTTTVAGVAAVAAPAAATAAVPAFKLRPAITGHVERVSRTAPLSTSDCLTQIGIHCYSPLQYRTAYNLNPLYARGVTGKGRTIVIVDSFGSPTIQHDLEVFDAQFGLPNINVQVVKAGNVPAFDPNNADHVGWAQETTLDVEYAHAIAPDAKIVLVETPVAETEGVTGLPEMMNAEKALIDKGVGDVISQSFGATENTFPGFDKGDFRSIQNLRYAFTDAALHGVTVLAASGDAGATDYQANGEDLYTFPVNSWPSSDPLVTSIGGTQLNLDNTGKRVADDVVWNDGYGAGGGGLSHVFPRPLFQAGVKNVVGNHRGTPDISMSAAVDGGAWVYYSFVGADSPWHIFGGTSEATPIFAGIVALADQQAGRRLGDLNAALYLLGAGSTHTHLPTGLVDVTSGDNSFEGVTGFPAKPGYDLSTGWGTIDANKFVPALAFL